MKIKIPKIPFQPIARKTQSLIVRTWAILTASPDISSITPKSCLTVSIERGAVSFIYLTRKFKKYTVQAERVYELNEKVFPPPRDVQSYLHLFLEEARLPRIPVTVVVPKSWVILKRGEFPVAVEDFLSEAIANEIDTLTPFNIEEIFYDFSVIDRTETNLYFLLGVIKVDRINPYIENLTHGGLNVVGLSVDLTALGTFLCFVNKDKNKNFLFCSVSGRAVEVAVYKDCIPILIHTDTLGHDNKEHGREISEIVNSASEYLYTEGNQENEKTLFFDSDNVSIKDEVFNNSELTVIPLQDFDTEPFKLTSQRKSVFGAMGAALQSLRTDVKDMNLLLLGKRQKSRKNYFLTVFLILLLVMSFISSKLIPYYKSKETLDELTDSVEKLEISVIQSKKMKKKIKELQEGISVIEDFGLHAYLPLEIMKELTKLIPKDTWLTKLRIRTDGIELEGYAQSATSLIVELEESRFFQKVEFSSPTIKDRRMKMDRFRIRAEINDNDEGSKEKKK